MEFGANFRFALSRTAEPGVATESSIAFGTVAA